MKMLRRRVARMLLKLAEWIYPDELQTVFKDAMVYGHGVIRIDPKDMYK